MFPTPGQYAAEANAHVDALADDERYRRLEGYEMLWSGVAYHARPSFWDSSVPLRERRPAVKSGILKASGSRLANMVFGERAFPGVSVEGQAYGVALSDEERDALAALASEIVRVASLRTRLRAYLTEGLKVGTSVALCELRAGRPSVKILPAKWCSADFDERGCITRLVIQYKHQRGAEWYWYRRELGDGLDLVRAPVVADKRDVVWSEVPVEGTPRAIDFVPAVWTRCGAEAVEEDHHCDGHPLCEGIEDEILALDMELSQLYRTALYNGEPQMVRVGVGGAANPMTAGPTMSADGRTAADGAGSFSWLNSVLPKGWTFGSQKQAARKGPGQIWDIPQGGDAKLLESSGAGAQIIKGAIDEYRRIVTDAVGVVLADPETLGKGDISARALTLMFGPMLDTASALRVEYGDALCSILDMLIRLAVSAPSGVYLATLDAARAAVAKLMRAREDGATAWMGVPFALQWGEFFEPSWSDVTAAIDAAQKATGGRPVLSQRAALRLVAPVVGVDDLDAEAADMERETGADASAMRETMGALAPPPDAPAVEAVADTALNGAQVDAMVALAEKVALGSIPLETAVRIAARAFQLSEPEARAMFSPAAQSDRAEAIAQQTMAAPAPAPAPPPVTDGPGAIE